MNSDNLDLSAVLNKLAAAPMSPKKRWRKKAQEAQLCFAFAATDNDDNLVVDDTLIEAIDPVESEVTDLPNLELGNMETEKSDGHRADDPLPKFVYFEMGSCRSRTVSPNNHCERRNAKSLLLPESISPYVLSSFYYDLRSRPRDPPG